ncbi:MAG: hypothetical protein MZV70_07530 [Desulfobacterales bacterium]|nr:hypothetical protein [Desulfobacterales bacterium]
MRRPATWIADAAAGISGDTPQFGFDQLAEVFLDPFSGKGVGAGDHPVTVVAALPVRAARSTSENCGRECAS